MNKAVKNILFIILLFVAIQLIVQVFSMVAGLLPVLSDALKHQPENIAAVFQQNATEVNLAVPLSISTIISSILTVFVLWKFNYIAFAYRETIAKNKIRILVICVPLMLCAMFFLNVLTELFPLQDDHEQMFLAMSRTGVWGFLAIAVFGPVCEEVTFRGAIEGILLKYTSPWKAVLCSALLFGLIHMNPVQIPFAFALGILLGWLYYKTGSLVPAILSHFINNATGFITMLTMKDSNTITGLLGKGTTFALMAASFILFVILLICFNKTCDKTTIKTIQ